MRRRNSTSDVHERELERAFKHGVANAQSAINARLKGDREGAMFFFREAVRDLGMMHAHISSLPGMERQRHDPAYEKLSRLINQAEYALSQNPRRGRRNAPCPPCPELVTRLYFGDEPTLPGNPKRPSGSFMKRCQTGVKKARSAYDPGAVCAAQWKRMSAAQKRAWDAKKNSFGVGSRVSAINIRDGQNGRPVRGVFTVLRKYSDGSVLIRSSDGREFRVPTTNLRLAQNTLAPGRSVPVEAITYLDKKTDDDKVYPYEHKFEGKAKPKLHYDGKNLKLKRAGSRYRVNKDLDGDYWIEG